MAEIIEVAGRRWIAGLRWRDCPPRPKMAVLREIGDELDMSWAAPRTMGSVSQAGFCRPIPGVKLTGLCSMAAAIAKAYPQPWLGVFKIAENKWFYIAVRDGHGILPRGDVIGDEDTIAKAQEEHDGYSGWEPRIGTLADLEPLLRDSRAEKRLVPVRSLEPISPWRVVLPPVVVLGVAAGGIVLWRDHEAAVRKAREAKLAAERAREAAAQRAISPLKRTPTPTAWLAACRTAVIDLPLSVDGWALSSLSCGTHAARVVWKREPGATVLARPKGAITDQGNKVEQAIGFSPLRPGADDAAGLAASETALYGLLQRIGVQAQMSQVQEPHALPGARAKHGPAPIPRMQVGFTLPVAPWDISFRGVPGLRLSTATEVKNGWHVKGTLYGR